MEAVLYYCVVFLIGAIVGCWVSLSLLRYNINDSFYKVEYVVPFEGAYYTRIFTSWEKAEKYIDDNSETNDYENGSWEMSSINID